MSKLKEGMQMRLSVMQFAAILFAVIHAMTLTKSSDAGENLSGTTFTMFLFGFSLFFVLVYIVAGPRLTDYRSDATENE